HRGLHIDAAGCDHGVVADLRHVVDVGDVDRHGDADAGAAAAAAAGLAGAAVGDDLRVGVVLGVDAEHPARCDGAPGRHRGDRVRVDDAHADRAGDLHRAARGAGRTAAGAAGGAAARAGSTGAVAGEALLAADLV